MRIAKDKFGFDFADPQRFTQSRWTQRDTVGKGYLLYKVFLALFWLAVFVVDITHNSLKTFTVKQAAKYLIFFTRWGFLLITLAVVYDTILVTLRYFDERRMRKKFLKTQSHFSECTPALKFGWFLTTCSYSTALFITVIFWTFLFDYSNGVDGVAAISVFLNLCEHLMQTVTALVDTWVSGRPHRLQHFWCSLLFGLVYMIFNVVYVVAFDGTDPNGRDYIYPVLKWNEEPGLSVAFVAGAAVAVPIFHALLHVLVLLRDKVWSVRYFDPENELLDGAPRSSASEKETGIRTVSFRKA